MRKLLSLGRDVAGSMVIEMALLAPILATMLIVMSDLSIAFSERLKLEQAAQTAIEKVMQGQASTTTDSAAALKAEAATLANVPADQVEVTFYLECVNPTTNVATATAWTAVCVSPQVSRRYMEVVIDKYYTPVFNQTYAGTNANGQYELRGRTSVRVQ